MYGPSVNLEFLESLWNLRECEGLPGLIDIGVCQLHAIRGNQHGIFKKFESSMANIPWQPSLKRWLYFITGSTSLPHHICATRWVKSKRAAERAKSLWEHVVKIVNFWKKPQKSKQPKCDSYNVVKDAVDDPLTVAKLEFFIYVVGLLEPYLKFYQSDHPLVPFIYFDLKKLVTGLLKLFVKAEIIDNCKTSFDLANIDLDKKSNFP